MSCLEHSDVYLFKTIRSGHPSEQKRHSGTLSDFELLAFHDCIPTSSKEKLRVQTNFWKNDNYPLKSTEGFQFYFVLF